MRLLVNNSVVWDLGAVGPFGPTPQPLSSLPIMNIIKRALFWFGIIVAALIALLFVVSYLIHLLLTIPVKWDSDGVREAQKYVTEVRPVIETFKQMNGHYPCYLKEAGITPWIPTQAIEAWYRAQHPDSSGYTFFFRFPDKSAIIFEGNSNDWFECHGAHSCPTPENAIQCEKYAPSMDLAYPADVLK